MWTLGLPIVLKLVTWYIAGKAEKDKAWVIKLKEWNEWKTTIEKDATSAADISTSEEEQLSALGDVAVDTPVDTPAITKVELDKQIIVAFISGHNVAAQGAINYKNVSEYVFFNSVFPHFKKHVDPRFKAVHVVRPSGTYHNQCKAVAKELRRLGAEFSIHNHFDSTGSPVVGTGSFYATFMEVKQKFHNAWVKNLGNTDRRLRKANNGLAMLEATPCPSILLEWCFGNHKHAEAEKIFNDPEWAGKILAQTVNEVL